MPAQDLLTSGNLQQIPTNLLELHHLFLDSGSDKFR